jgi:transposase
MGIWASSFPRSLFGSSAGSGAGELGVDDETYVRRRRWSVEEKRAVVDEALSSGNVIATAKRHRLQAQQIYRWRERLDERQSPAAFLAVSIARDHVPRAPAPLLDQDSRGHSPAVMLDRSPRVEIVLSTGRRIIAEGGLDIDAMLRLARGLEALR